MNQSKPGSVLAVADEKYRKVVEEKAAGTFHPFNGEEFMERLKMFDRNADSALAGRGKRIERPSVRPPNIHGPIVKHHCHRRGCDSATATYLGQFPKNWTKDAGGRPYCEREMCRLAAAETKEQETARLLAS